ncbi:sulfotransferase family protein [Nocardioides sp. GXQ0305]|uniref:sulfotransferase family protein n=1 Tax=Nocardioides sp. GXQ0305 TaxID=3423912 RepID=UPI003D7F12E7
MTTTDGSAPSSTTPRVVVVAGSGRSGTSTIAGVLKTVGLVIPPPEVPGNRTNPRGFFEPRWAVDLQTRLLRRSQVFLTDARPAAFDLTEGVSDDGEVRAEVAAWLREHLADGRDLVVKDPRNSWFLPLWQRAAAEAGGEAAFLTMLRHPAEVVGSKDKYYKSTSAGETPRHAQTTRVASWLNVALFTEATTRDAPRSFVPYNDLLDDWRSVVRRVVDELDLTTGRDVDDAAAAEVDAFVDPGLRRVRTGWDDIDCPTDVREMAQDVWDQLGVLAASGGFDDPAQQRLDEVRERYTALYADAEALAQSSAEDARRAGVKQGRRALLKEQRRAARQSGGAVAGSADADHAGAVRRARSAVRRVSRRLRRP